MKKLVNNIIILFVISAFSLSAQAETAEEKGLRIANEMDQQESGFIDSVATLTMELRNKQGESSIRELRIKTLEVTGDGDKSLSIFDTPKDVKGTAFLTFSHSHKPDEQWLYLPSLKRVKRISSRNKSGPFMGSEFAFEDLSSQEVDKYSYKYMQDENINGIDCYVIERIPTYKNSGYKRLITWINKKDLRPEKIVFYDRKNSKLKTLTFTQYKKYLERYWRADHMLMENHVTGKSTTLSWKSYKFKTGLKSKDFSRNSLKRAR